jgi:hypothetical protein
MTLLYCMAGKVVCGWLLLAGLTALAAEVAQPATLSTAGAPTEHTRATMHEASPTWSQLSERQKTALTPLKKLWPEINEAQKRKWLAVSRNYRELPEQEQQKMHERMREWVAMGPRDRAHVRLEYARAQTLSVDERRARWEAYQALSDDERKKLADASPRKPKGAAIALQPVPTSKIVTPPQAADHTLAQGFSALRIDIDQSHPKTLLPLNVPGHASP